MGGQRHPSEARGIGRFQVFKIFPESMDPDAVDKQHAGHRLVQARDRIFFGGRCRAMELNTCTKNFFFFWDTPKIVLCASKTLLGSGHGVAPRLHFSYFRSIHD